MEEMVLGMGVWEVMRNRGFRGEGGEGEGEMAPVNMRWWL